MAAGICSSAGSLCIPLALTPIMARVLFCTGLPVIVPRAVPVPIISAAQAEPAGASAYYPPCPCHDRQVRRPPMPSYYVTQ
jgi:hypothetical protein